MLGVVLFPSSSARTAGAGDAACGRPCVPSASASAVAGRPSGWPVGAAATSALDETETEKRASAFGKGRMGSALMASLQISCFLTDFLGTPGLPFTYFYLPKSARAYRPQSVRIHYLRQCSGPIIVEPICPQPKRVWRLPGVVPCSEVHK